MVLLSELNFSIVRVRTEVCRSVSRIGLLSWNLLQIMWITGLVQLLHKYIEGMKNNSMYLPTVDDLNVPMDTRKNE